MTMYYLNKLYIFTIILGYLKITKSALQSPCPDIFEYRYDNENKLYGFVQVLKPNDGSNVIQIDVQLSVGNTVAGFNGNIALASSRSQILDDILHQRSLQYNIHFPYWTNVPPKITKIAVNGNQICDGYPIKKNSAPVITTINLQHTLTIGISSKHENLPNFPVHDDAKKIPQIIVVNPPKNPYLPIDFRPEISKDPPKMYPVHERPHNHKPFHEYPEPDFYYHFPDRHSLDYDDKEFFHKPYNPNKFNQENVPRPQSPTVPVSQTTENVQDEDLPTVETNLVQKPFSKECGISVNSNSLLINGNRVAKGAHPWLAALFLQNNEGLKFMCGSTLISERHVVTAGHCIKSRSRKFRPEELWVVLGRENIQRWSNDGAQIIQALSTHIHDDYQFNTADADIAVIGLSENAVFSPLIRPICLWTGNNNVKLIVEKKGTIVGWGKDESGRAVASEPKEIKFPVVSEEDCLRSNIGFREITSNRTFCGGYRNNSGPCNGDSGGGFLMQVNGRWTLRGVVSMSLLGTDGNCDLTQYVVFTDVSKFTDWLLSFLP